MSLSTKSFKIRSFLATWADFFERAIPLILALILGLIILMAVTSGFDRHPDEKQHYAAARYYVNHWLPPAVGAPEAADAYSKYGASYLDDLDVVYLLAAKFSHLLSPVIAKEYLALRLFNVFLFFLLVLYCTFNIESRPIFFWILITPQVWYIFSYFNNDAISLFIALIITAEIINEHSFFQRFLKAARYRQFILGGILLGLLLGLLFLCKRNYYLFIIFIFFLVFWQIWQNRGTSQRQILLRYLAVIGIGLTVFLSRYGYDVAVNGWDKADKMVAYAEKTAIPEFKPSVAYSSDSYYGLHLRAKGLKYSELFSKWEWHKISFRSFFGVYDYMQLFSSSRYYSKVYYVLLLFLIYITGSVLLKGEKGDKIFMVLVWGFISASILLSTYHSWVNDFQAQGRYLFPILGMLGALLYKTQKIMNKGLVAIFVVALCGLAAYSFIFTGLSQLMTSVPCKPWS